MTERNNDPDRAESIPNRPLPDPPKVMGFEASGNDLADPTNITVSVEFLTPGIPEPYEASVLFSVTDGVAKLRRVEEDFHLPQTLVAADAASDKVSSHPAVKSVEGVDAMLNTQREWVDDCEQYAETGWAKIRDELDSEVAEFVEGYEHETGDRLIIWNATHHQDFSDYVLEYRDNSGEPTETAHETIDKARAHAVGEIFGSTSE
ncbi:hypothetical protein EXE48_11775 [Halorubrum sp. ASP1]|uniref:hypothetical protein n=1 Tax=Halorubrum sp. ASP1 TaxID=2518114 RepID=UPI0010F6A760|nr:hypothetical protein [Halorubrum sp. ASP1]TKX60644.1 hypothetical protein EXE48_11775 [Halorubrum sp. ASP1]